MDRFTLICYTVPVAQPRQRHAVVAGKVRNYTPEHHPVQTFKADLRLAAVQAGLPPEPWDGPLTLSVQLYLPRPASLMRAKDPDGPVPHAVKPDLGNTIKAVEDALTGLVWRDDKQICREILDKWYCEKGGRPRVELEVQRYGLGPVGTRHPPSGREAGMGQIPDLR